MSKVDQVDLSKPVKCHGCRVNERDYPSFVILSAVLNRLKVWRARETAGASVPPARPCLVGVGGRGRHVAAALR